MIKYFLNNRLSAFMIALACLMAGIISLLKLPVSLVPSSDYPAVSVLIEYPGVSPEKIELVITKPVERIIKGVNGIKEIESVSEEGKSKINVIFNEKTDIKIASLKLREKIELIKDNFPEEVQEPIVYRYDPSERPIIIAALEKEGVSVEGVREIVDRIIKPSLQRVDGVSEIYVSGGSVREIHIETDRSSLEARGLTFNDISLNVKNSNVSVPGGAVDTGSGQKIISIPSRFRSVKDIEDLILYSDDNGVIYLKDIASVYFSSREKEDLSRFNGKDIVTIYIHKGGDANSLGVCSDLKEVLSSFKEMKLKIIYNQGEYIESAVNNAAFSGLWGMMVVFFILSVFFRKKETVIPLVFSIPCSILIVPVFLYLSSRGINIMSLSGFALSAGLVVDNGIVIMEAITSSEDKTIDGILSAVNSVKTAVIASTFTTIAVFAPIALLSDRAESMYGEMTFTVVRALIVSLLFSILLTPAFYLSLKNSRLNIPMTFKNIFLRRFKKPADLIISFEALSVRYYEKILAYVFKNSFRVISMSVGVILISAILFSIMEKDSVKDNGGREFYLYMEFPTGTSLESTDVGVRGVEKLTREFDGVEDVTVKVEKWRGTLTVCTTKDIANNKIDEIKAELKKKADLYLNQFNAFSYISETDESTSREVSVHFLGDDIETLKKITKKASLSVQNIEGVEECYLRYREGRPEYTLAVDRDKCGMSGITSYEVAERLRGGLFGSVITKFIEKGREIDVRLILGQKDRYTVDNILFGTIKNRNGDNISLSEVINLSESEASTRIYRMNGIRSLAITAKLKNISIFECENKIRKIIESMNIPSEYTYRFDRKINEFRKEKNEMITAVIVSILLVFMILASLFESLSIPFLVMITIPLSVAGAVPVLFLTSTPISPSVYMGFIMVTGIVVNNGILLIDPVSIDYRNEKIDDNNLLQNIRTSSLRRFRPVMLTVLTTVSGMIPLLVGDGNGSSLWFPFALTVSSGLFFSTIFTVAVFPLLAYRLYRVMISRKNKNILKLKNFMRSI